MAMQSLFILFVIVLYRQVFLSGPFAKYSILIGSWAFSDVGCLLNQATAKSNKLKTCLNILHFFLVANNILENNFLHDLKMFVWDFCSAEISNRQNAAVD
jgi:hypothetical protein